MTVGPDDFQSKNRAVKNHNLTGMEKQKSLHSVFVEGPFLEIPNAPCNLLFGGNGDRRQYYPIPSGNDLPNNKETHTGHTD